ncbi:Uncharacterized conserved protein [Marinitoga hydrogenitolerans DSM 16785]|uniref:Uncharacterized conserved protein n=1 Tax=Marinitoga hydrogenitolerans (strain DSM 16785 / JCM 12826 / AT1271) TaxID=1122195 RepID=A0A1M4UR21_MARH1|nr:hypothetical protein [Marinitoga hydrogenitolerans]SHE59135.1 Uncharacterized conserved protein [Marinitoga hydrogenitolerans DSM 16785]
MKKYSMLFVISMALIVILSSCFKAVPVGKLNTDDIRVDLSTNYDIYSQVNASAIELRFDTNIPRDAFIYDKNNSLLLVKNYGNETLVMVSKAQRDIVKGEKLFSIKRNYLNPEQSKIITKAAIFDEESNKIITKATAPYQDGLSVSDATNVLTNDSTWTIIHAENISGVEAFSIEFYYDENFMEIENKGVDGDGVDVLLSNVNKATVEKTGGKLLIEFSTINGEELTMASSDLVKIYWRAKNVDPKQTITLSVDATLLNNALQKVTVDKHTGEVTIYNPKLLGDFDDISRGLSKDKVVNINDFIAFLDHYGSKIGDVNYDSDFDIYPSEITPVGEWKSNNIYSIAFPDGKIDLYDFIIFSRNYNKTKPELNTPPGAFDLTGPGDGSSVSAGSVVSFTWSAPVDPDGDAITYDLYLDTNPNPTTIYVKDLTTNSYSDTFNQTGVTYYWKVVAKDPKGGTRESDSTRSFSINPVDRIYAAGGYEGIFIFDAAYTNKMVQLQSQDTDGYAYDIVKIDTSTPEKYLLVADGSEGIISYHLNAGVPEVDNTDIDGGKISLGGITRKLAKKEDSGNYYIFAAVEDAGIKILKATFEGDGARDTDFQLLGSYSVTGKTYDITYDGTIAYVAAGTEGLLLLDISDYSNPILITSINTDNNSNSVDINSVIFETEGSNKYIYATAKDKGVIKYDVTDENNVIALYSFDTPGYAEDAVYSTIEDALFVADGTMGIVKLKKSDLSYVGVKGTNGYAKSLDIDGSTIYIFDSFNGLVKMDSNLSIMDDLVSAPYDADTVGANSLVGMNARKSIVIETDYNESGILDANEVAIIVADKSGGVRILKNDGSIIAVVKTRGSAEDVWFDGTRYLYVADGAAGVSVIDLDSDGDGNVLDDGSVSGTADNPPYLTNNYVDTDGYAYSLLPSETANTYLYVADSAAGIAIINIASAGAPVYDKNVSVDGKVVVDLAKDVTNNIIFAALGDDGIGSLTYAAENALTFVERYDTDGYAFSIEVSNIADFVVVADGSAGFVLKEYNTANGKFSEDGPTDGNTTSDKYAVRFEDAMITDVVYSSSNGGFDYYLLSAGNKGIISFQVDPADLIGLDNSDGRYPDGDSDNNKIVDMYDTQGSAMDVTIYNDATAWVDKAVLSDSLNGILIFSYDYNTTPDFEFGPSPFSNTPDKDLNWYNLIGGIAANQ